jgi:hypothetical protein
MITYYLLSGVEVYDEDAHRMTICWHIVDDYQTDRGRKQACAVLHNTHPGLKGMQSVVADYDLEESLARQPSGLFA